MLIIALLLSWRGRVYSAMRRQVDFGLQLFAQKYSAYGPAYGSFFAAGEAGGGANTKRMRRI
jgi:hypothetical protein